MGVTDGGGIGGDDGVAGWAAVNRLHSGAQLIGAEPLVFGTALHDVGVEDQLREAVAGQVEVDFSGGVYSSDEGPAAGVAARGECFVDVSGRVAGGGVAHGSIEIEDQKQGTAKDGVKVGADGAVELVGGSLSYQVRALAIRAGLVSPDGAIDLRMPGQQRAALGDQEFRRISKHSAATTSSR